MALFFEKERDMSGSVNGAVPCDTKEGSRKRNFVHLSLNVLVPICIIVFSEITIVGVLGHIPFLLKLFLLLILILPSWLVLLSQIHNALGSPDENRDAKHYVSYRLISRTFFVLFLMQLGYIVISDVGAIVTAILNRGS